jgi:DNA-binding LacI/PurR family transcriptional regulator
MKISEVAKKAGVSPSTVSRAINHPELLKKPTLEKIEKVIKELDYTPHPAAQSLMTGKTKIIGLIVPNLLNPFIAQISVGIEEELFSSGYTTITFNSHEGFEKEKIILHTLNKRMVDGLIWAYPHEFKLDLVKGPLVVIGPWPEDFETHHTCYDNIALDEKDTIRLAIERLASIGIKQIGIITGGFKYNVTKQRMKFVYEFCKQYHVEIDEQHIVVGDYSSIESGYQAMEEMMSRGKLPPGLFAFNDNLAIGALNCLNHHKIKIPDDMAIISTDDVPIAAHVTPALTTIASFGFELGRRSAQFIISRINNPELPTRSELVPVELIIRETC